MSETFTKVRYGLVGILLLFCAAVSAQTISGNVKDANGEPVIGATIMEQGTQNGTVTDFDGNFTLKLQKGGNINVSYVGMKSQVIKTAGKSSVNVTLEDDNTTLNDLVVVGYGTMKKKDLTGSVSSVKSDELAKVASANALQAMQGKVAGVDLTQSSGEAGAGVSITLRGNRSISASNSPLILVDGVEYGSTLDINPNDIESMDILKDAASTAIYGTKGANGVIIITTKHGQSGKTRVNFNSYVSINSATHVPEIMYGAKEVQRLVDAENYKADLASGNWGESAKTAEDVLSAYAATSETPYGALDIYNEGTYTDWLDEILKVGSTQNYDISVSGGNDKTTFNTSLALMVDNGLMRKDKMKRYNGKVVVDHKFNKYVKTGMNMLFTYKDQDKRNNSVYNQALKMTSIARPYITQADIDNGWTQSEVGDIVMRPSVFYPAHANPLLDEVDGAFQRNIEQTRLFGNAYIEVTPITGLTYRSMLALDRKVTRDGTYQDYESVAMLQGGKGYIDRNEEFKTSYTWENTVNWMKTFNDLHDLNILLGHHMDQCVTEYYDVAGATKAEHYYTSAWRDARNITSPVLDNTYTKQSMLSFFGRVNYSFMDRYLLQASLRADGSSVLAEGNKWGYFPSVSVGWRMSEEKWLKNVEWLSNLKLRASFGVSGNAAVSPYQTTGALSKNDTYYNFDGSTVISGKEPSSLSNKDLTWEKTSAWNLGLDFGIIKNRLNGSLELYWSKTKDLLYYRSLPSSSGYSTVIANVGETKGNGFEMSLNALPVKNKNFSWEINASASFSRDEVTKLSDGITRNISGVTGQIVGEPVLIYYDYEQDGCWKVGEYEEYKAAFAERHDGAEPSYSISSYGTPGTIKIVDRNDDGVLDDNDKKVYNRSPKAIFGMTNTFAYKQFTLSFQMYARLGGYIKYDFNSHVTYDNSNWANLDYWTFENQDAKFPSPGADKATWTTYGTAAHYEKADFLKFKDITLSYTVPNNAIKKIGLSRLRFYGSLKNFFTISGIDNYDPERGGSINFPLAKQVVLGMNIEF